MNTTFEIDSSVWADSFESSAEWRREKAKEYPEDATRLLGAAKELDNLAAQFAAGDLDPDLLREYAELAKDDDLAHQAGSVESEMTREIGFHASYDKADDFVREPLRRVKRG